MSFYSLTNVYQIREEFCVIEVHCIPFNFLDDRISVGIWDKRALKSMLNGNQTKLTKQLRAITSHIGPCKLFDAVQIFIRYGEVTLHKNYLQ